jgi:Uma2 family endonuclease
MAIAQRMSEQEYREFALTAEGRRWELWDGMPREKPLMSLMHGDVASFLGHLLLSQLDRREYRVYIDSGRAKRSERNYFIPDVLVVSASFVLPERKDPGALGAFSEPLPLVVEIWSRTTAAYDYAVKLQAYRERGDREIWFIQPYERTLTAWRWQPDGSYSEEVHRGGIVPVASLPGVTIDFDDLLDR